MNREVKEPITHPSVSKVAENYRTNQLVTAGRIQSIILLLTEAEKRLGEINLEDSAASRVPIVGCQNIVALLEMALNHRHGKVANMFFLALELIYESLENLNEKSLKVARYVCTHLKESLEMSQRRDVN